MHPFYVEIGKRVMALNEDQLYTALKLRDCGDLADLLIMRAAAKIGKDRRTGLKQLFEPQEPVTEMRP